MINNNLFASTLNDERFFIVFFLLYFHVMISFYLSFEKSSLAQRRSHTFMYIEFKTTTNRDYSTARWEWHEKRENKQSTYMIHCFGFDCMCNNRGVSMCAFDVSVIAACHTTRKFQLFSIKCTILFMVFALNFKLFMNIECLNSLHFLIFE